MRIFSAPRPLALLSLSLALCGAPAGQALAQFNFLPEIRAGVFSRGVDHEQNLLDPERISDANVELLFSAPDLNAWTVVGELRPHMGATVSFKGEDPYAYAGLSWTVRAPILPVFVEASAGGVVHGSLLNAPQGDPSRALGCGAGLRLAASAGLDLPLGTSLIGTLEHLPDFGTCGTSERADTNVGVRLGFRF